MSAQIAVAVAGFAGVAAAFGSEPIRAWSQVDRMRLRFLLGGAAVPLMLALFGMAVLVANVGIATASVWCSSVAFVVQSGWQFLWARAVVRTPRAALIQAHFDMRVFYTQWLAVSICTLLQLYNMLVLRSFWPFYLLLATQLASATVQFIRLILHRGHPPQGLAPSQ